MSRSNDSNGCSAPHSSVSTVKMAFSFLDNGLPDRGLRTDSGVAGLPTDRTDRSSPPSSEGIESHDDDREYVDCSSIWSWVDSSSRPNEALLPRPDFNEESLLHSCTSSSMDIRRLLWLCLSFAVLVLLGGGMAVTASKAATAGGRASGRWRRSEDGDGQRLRVRVECFGTNSQELREEGISTGFDGCRMVMIEGDRSAFEYERGL